MRRISHQQLAEQIRGGKVLERDPAPERAFDTKVLLSADGMIYKFFRARRFFSSNLFSPYARRFAGNARRLIKAGWTAPDVRNLFYVAEIRRQVAVYPWIEGDPLQAYFAGPESLERKRHVFYQLGRFMAGMHHRGVLFRSGHLNNYLKTPEEGFALIDVTDVQFCRGPLSRRRRVKSVRLLVRRPQDTALVESLGWDNFLAGYGDEARSLDASSAPLELEELRMG